MAIMKPAPTDIDRPAPIPKPVPLTGLTAGQVHIVCAQTRHRMSPHPGRPSGLPLRVRVVLVLVHLRTNLTTRALAALFGISQSSVDRIVHHLVPVLADALRPDTTTHSGPWIIDDTLIPVHDQSITAISKNYRRSVNTQIIICAHRRRVMVAGPCWPGNRNDVIVARHTAVQLLDGRVVLGDGGYRGITSITTPRRDHTSQDHPTTTTAPTGASGPASNTSSPGSRTGRYCGNADAAARPSTTASKSSSDSGT